MTGNPERTRAIEDALGRLAPIGRDARGGVTREAWTPVDLELRAWFGDEARRRDLTIEQDVNGNSWAWWGDRGPGAVVTGSHLDSVPNGGEFDGPLGVISGFLAVDELRSRGVEPTVPLAVAAFSDEEGARFGVACVGSRLLTGTLDPTVAGGLRDREGHTLAEAMEAAGTDPRLLGPEPDRITEIAAFVELHIEQGRELLDRRAPVGVATAIWPHGRWRFRFVGEANHAGTTRLEDRRDPLYAFVATATVGRELARRRGARVTFGRVEVTPNATNAIASTVDAWLDARAESATDLVELVDEIASASRDASTREGVQVELTTESRAARLDFSAELRARISTILGGAPELATAAGHDAGVLGAVVPTAMLFVRNPTGVSHSPLERASLDDCADGADALATVLEQLVQP